MLKPNFAEALTLNIDAAPFGMTEAIMSAPQEVKLTPVENVHDSDCGLLVSSENFGELLSATTIAWKTRFGGAS